MKDYADKRKFECFEILYNMGSYMLVSDKLTFIGKNVFLMRVYFTKFAGLYLTTYFVIAGKYCEFHKLYGEREYKNAATLLVSLISSGIAPPK